MKLDNVVTMRTGKNFSRNKGTKEEVVPYTYENLIQDLSEFAPYQSNETAQEIMTRSDLNSEDDSYLVSAGDVIFSFVSSTAGIVSKSSEGKALNQNFSKLIIENQQLDPRYLCYCLNQSSHLKRQMAVAMQGSTLRRLTPSSLRALDIPIVDFSQQQSIGHAYFSLLKRQYLLEREMQQEEEFVLALLETQLESKTTQEENNG